MTGLDSAIAALLAGRADILLDAIRPLSSSTPGATTAQTGTSQLFIDTPRGNAPTPPVGTYTAPAPSSQTAISDVARTLDAISRFGGVDTPPLTGNSPLWPTAPRAAAAASAFATLSGSGSLFSADAASGSGSGSVSGSASVSSAGQPAPMLPADVLASMLARTVSESGLFYESHIVQWLAGQRSLASLTNEPQARIDNLSAASSFNSPPPGDAQPDMWIDETLLPSTFSADTPDPLGPIRLVPTPQTPQQAAALAASVRTFPPNVFLSAGTDEDAGSGSGSSAPAGRAHDPAVQASISSGIHPSTIPLVRQQLDIFATEHFRWVGEAWPGAKFEWEIQPRNRGARERDTGAAPSSGDTTERAWQTRITLSLPSIGHIDADLVLNGQQLVVRLNASADGALLLARDGAHFQQQLEAAGLQLAGLSVRAMDALAESTGEASSNLSSNLSSGSSSSYMTPQNVTSIPPASAT